MKAPPRDGTMIVAQFKNYPTKLTAIWHKIDENWVAAVPHVEPINNDWSDWYFETEPFEDKDLEDWWSLDSLK